MKKILLRVALVLPLFLFYAAAQSAGVETVSDDLESAVLSEDHGNTPWIADIEEMTMENTNFRTAKWTGKYIQMTLMSIPAEGQIGGETHHFTDQFIRVESGKGRVMMGGSENSITFDKEVSADWVILIPAGYWHNIYNTGDEDLKLYSIYGPPQHLPGTIHVTSADAKEDHHD